MLNKIIKYSLSNRAVILLFAGLMLILGCWTIFHTEVDIFPDLNAPTVVVMTEAPGFAPEEVEKMVTFPIETNLNGASGVRRVRSSSATGFSVVWVEFDWDTDIFRARQIVSEKLAAISSLLPPGCDTPTLGPQSSILGEIMIISLTSDTVTMRDLRSLADRTIAPRLLSLGGVSQVSVLGGDVEEYQIKVNPAKMKYFGVTLDEVRDAAQNINNNASGGVIYDYGNEYLIKATLHTSAVNELAKSVVKSSEKGVVTFDDIATVEIGGKSPRLGVASERGVPAVIITVTKQPETGSIELTKSIDRELTVLSKSMPEGVNISTDIFRQSDFIENSISNLQISLFEGSIFVILVIFFFLMNIRTTLISVVALPLSIALTLLILYWCGLSINTMSLGGIAIAIGSLVDDAIVDVENVYRRLKLNFELPKDKRENVLNVIYESSREVRLPILNSSLIIVASFLPLFFLSGIEGRMLIPLGISFIVALASSTLVALTITPVLCYYLLKNEKKLTHTSNPWLSRRLSSRYEKLLPKAIANKKKLLIITGGLIVAAIILVPFLGRSFLPSFNEGSLTINVSTLPGISLDESDKIGREAEKIILSIPEIRTVARKTGRAELDEHSLGVNVSEIEAPYTLSSRSRADMVKDLRNKLKHLPGANIEIGQPISHRIDAMLSGTEAQIAIKIFGSELNKLHNIATSIKNTIKDIDGIVDVNVEQIVDRPQLEIKPRRNMMARYGLTNNQFATYVSTMLGGEVVSQVYRDGLPFDITLKVDDNSRATIADISRLMIDSNSGPIPFSAVAEIVSSTGPNTINRENVNRRIVVSTNIEGSDLRGSVEAIKKAIEEKVKIPQGYYVQYSGQFENEEAASKTLALASLGAILLIFLILYHEYKKITYSGIILLNMPLALIGGIFILYFTGSELNIPAIIGFISLMGISTRNGMLLISHYNTLEQEGLSLMQRIYKGSSDRLNPIIMTALTSALALIPLALRSTEPGNEIQSPMALVILGGLITSTLLNIFIVPIFYYLVNRKN